MNDEQSQKKPILLNSRKSNSFGNFDNQNELISEDDIPDENSIQNHLLINPFYN